MDGKLDIEVHDGRVVAVWFNCQLLPFEQFDIDAARLAALAGGQNPAGAIASRIDVEYADGANA